MAVDKVLVQAVTAHQAGRLEEAEKLYRKILLTRPRESLAAQNLGVLLYERGDLEEAGKLARRTISINPQNPDGYINLGNILRDEAKLEEAITNFRKAIALRPSALAYNNLGNVLYLSGALDEAIACFEEALRLQPQYLHSHYHLAMVYRQTGRMAEAISIQEQALAINPRFHQLLLQLGTHLYELGRYPEAIARYREALAVVPGYTEAWSSLGNALQRSQDLIGAEAAYREALRLNPDHSDALGNLGTLLAEQGRRSDAIKLFERLTQTHPSYPGIWGKLSFEKRHNCDWDNFDALEGKLRQMAREGLPKISPFWLITLNSSPQEQLANARSYAEGLRQPAMTLPQRAPQRRDKIRIGYLSADFHPHATAYLMAELFERHDRSCFDIAAYSIGPDSDSDMRRRLVSSFDRFVDLRTLSHGDAAQRIHADDVDILIDLKGYTQNSRPEILACRPAQVQVNYLGYPGTMGASFIDYILADRFLIPSTQHGFYEEKVVTLPHCYQPNDTRRQISNMPLQRSMFGLPGNGFVFACFNNPYKLTPQIFDIWMRLLDQVPGSVLWQLQVESETAANLQREAQARGVDPQRLVFAQPLAQPIHLARQALADLFLDTLPVNAHTTASDALWAGLPVLTCAGETFISRVAGSLLTAVGLPELVTTNLQDYEALALALARDPARLASLRQQLAQNRHAPPLFDIARFTRNLESAYQQIWERRLSGQPPTAFEVEDNG